MSRGARGFSLVESLVALLVLTVGLLGAWSLQLSSLRAHNESVQQAAAMELLQDMAERIRANSAAGGQYASSGLSAPSAGCTSASPCSAGELAAVDVAWFMARAVTLFPGRDTATRVEFVPATGALDADDFAVSLQWRGARERQSATLHVPVPPVAG